MHDIKQVDLRGVVGLVVDCVRRTGPSDQPEAEPVQRRHHADMVP